MGGEAMEAEDINLEGQPGIILPGSKKPKLLAKMLPYRGVYWEPRALPMELYNRIRGREE